MLLIDRQLGERIYVNGLLFELLDIGNNSAEVEFNSKTFSMNVNSPIKIENSHVTLIKLMETTNFKTNLKEYTARFGIIGNDEVLRGELYE